MKLSELTNPQLAVIAVARLGGDTRAVDSEDVALTAYKIAPKRFCWRKYPKYIDIATVRFSLSDAAKTELAFLSGNNKDGWMLTPAGVKWMKSIPSELIEVEGTKRRSLAAAVEADRSRLRHTSAFTKFSEDKSKDISLMEFFEFVRINEYFPDRKRLERMAAIENAVVDDAELTSLWNFMKKRFRKEIESHE